jgi:hypothetical protein
MNSGFLISYTLPCLAPACRALPNLAPDHEQAVREAIRAGKVTSVDELTARAIASLPKGDETLSVSSSSSVYAQGLSVRQSGRRFSA